MTSSLGMAQQLASLNSPSKDECHRKDSTVEIQACDSQRYQYADKQLNVIYSAAIKNLDEDRKAKLRDSPKRVD
ncbi:lysozyme inhibitor LprI family protein [Polynucleobacter necessarius]|uniref:lysozyme inhibitor LprI family protein n=1 Tax=Polynucleobacter necessarius TaxID=576610 RepID=UPI000E09DCEA|nr:lysozyme inhibitor LprI family protein [Polynucleobacter necessarius]